ncbi:MAG: CcmD family protein [Terriglobia bacterium]
MEIGLKHLFYAFALVWVLHIGYLLNLARRQKRLGEELRALKDILASRRAGSD